MSLCIGNVGGIAGGTVAGIVLFIVLPIIIGVVVGCCNARASSRQLRTTVTTNVQPASTTETVITTSSQQDCFKANPSAPQPQEAYPPPKYPYPPQGNAFEMTAYPPQPPPPQGAYLAQPQEVYPPPPYPNPPQVAYPAYPPQQA